MSFCKHPEEVCCSMTLYHGKVYCDNTNGFCQLYDEPLPETNADHIRGMEDEELAVFLEQEALQKCPCPTKNCEPSCGNCILNWLRQPYKENQ